MLGLGVQGSISEQGNRLVYCVPSAPSTQAASQILPHSHPLPVPNNPLPSPVLPLEQRAGGIQLVEAVAAETGLRVNAHYEASV